MTSEGVGRVIRHLQAFYPTGYPASMTKERLQGLYDGLSTAYDTFTDEEVMVAYNKLLKSGDRAPAVAAVMATVRASRTAPKTGVEWEINENGEAVPLSSRDIGPHEKCPNPNSRALRAMLTARAKMRDPSKDEHDWNWYKTHYPERPEERPMDIEDIIASF